MYRLIPFFLVLIACSSCSIYQYNVFSSNQEYSPDEPFTYENDSLKLSYSFSKGSTQIEIYNKTNKPLYVDWTKSALVANGVSESYWDGKSAVNLTTKEYSSVISPRISNGSATGTITNKAAVSFIPPASKLINSATNISNLLPKEKGKLRNKSYDEQSSPLKLRSYLAFSFDPELSSTKYYEHSFWLAETYRYDAKPIVTPKQNAYLSKRTTKAGVFTAGVVGFGLMVWAASLNSPSHNTAAR